MFILAGLNDLSNLVANSSYIFKAAVTFAAPQYVSGCTSPGCLGDIGLIQLNRPVPATDASYTPRRPALPISLVNPEQMQKLIPSNGYASGVVTGWGDSNNDIFGGIFGSEPLGKLRQLDVQVYRGSVCKGAAADRLCDSRPPLASGKGTCFGDSGGPVVIPVDPANPNSTMVLAGVVSTVPGKFLWIGKCGSAGSIDTFVDVSKYSDWIRSIVERDFFIDDVPAPGTLSIAEKAPPVSGAVKRLVSYAVPAQRFPPGTLGILNDFAQTMLFVVPTYSSNTKPGQLEELPLAKLKEVSLTAAEAGGNLSSPLVGQDQTIYVWSVSSQGDAELYRRVKKIWEPIEAASFSGGALNAFPQVFGQSMQPITGDIYVASPAQPNQQNKIYKWSPGDPDQFTQMFSSPANIAVGYPTFDPAGNLYVLMDRSDGIHVGRYPLEFAQKDIDGKSDVYGPLDDLGVIPGASVPVFGGLSLGYNSLANLLLVTLPGPKIVSFDPVTKATATLITSANSQEFFSSPMVGTK
jgi:hypothetical protein